MQYGDNKEQIKEQLRLARMLRRGIGSSVMLAGTVILFLLSRKTDWFADWYSGTVYKLLVNTIGRAASLFPFSVAEIILYVILVLAAVKLVCFLVSVIRTRDKIKIRLLAGAVGILHFVISLVFLYTLACGINYQRKPFSEVSGLQVREYTLAELKSVCERLTGELNRLAPRIERDAEGRAVAGDSVNAQARRAMKELGKRYPSIAGYYPRPKALMASQLLSWQNLSGIYSPFTIEANYNGDMAAYNIPFTACHELSHLRGFMREDEANFIAYLACLNSDNLQFQYSGRLLGWIYAMNVLYDADRETYTAIRNTLDARVRADLKANSLFWDKYRGRAAELSDKVNDTYLKANKQEDGIKSYDRMTDLLVAYELGRED